MLGKRSWILVPKPLSPQRPLPWMLEHVLRLGMNVLPKTGTEKGGHFLESLGGPDLFTRRASDLGFYPGGCWLSTVVMKFHDFST